MTCWVTPILAASAACDPKISMACASAEVVSMNATYTTGIVASQQAGLSGATRKALVKSMSMKTLGGRLKFRRSQLGLSQPEVARRVTAINNGKPFSQQAYQQLESGKARNSVHLPAICDALEVDLRWIRDGKGNPPDATETKLDSPTLTSSIETELDRDRRNVIVEADVRTGAGGGGVRHSEHVVYDKNGNTYAAEGIAGEWTLPQPVLSGMLRASPQHIRVFEVIGNSMEPRLSEGDRVFVDTRLTQPNPEGIFVLWDGFSIVVKQLQIVRGSEPLKLKVISVNEQYAPYDVLAEEVNIIGRYVGRFTTG